MYQKIRETNCNYGDVFTRDSLMTSLMDVGKESWCEGQNIGNQIVTIVRSITGTGVIKTDKYLCTVQQVSLYNIYIHICIY